MPTCFVPGCRTGYGQSKGVHLFSPPSDKMEFQKWVQAIPRKDKELTRKCYVCYCHFSEEMIIKVDTFNINGETVQLPRSKWKLKPGAVPHIFPNLPKYLSKPIKNRKPPSDRKNNQTSNLSVKFNKSERDLVCKEQEVNQNEGTLGTKQQNDLTKKDLRKGSDAQQIIASLRKKIHNQNRNLVRTQNKLKVAKARITALEKEINVLKNDVTKSKQLKFLSKKQKIIVDTMLKKCEKEKCKTGVRYDDEFLLDSLLLKIKSPKGYRHCLQHNLLPLPAESHLRKLVKGMKCRYGINKHAVDAISNYFSDKDENSRNGILIFDEVKLREEMQFNSNSLKVDGFIDLGGSTPETNKIQLANHALVFMYVPLLFNWVQPVAVFATHNAAPGDVLSHVLLQVIIQLEEHGVKVVGFTHDGSQSNKKLWINLGISGKPRKVIPSIPNPVDNTRKIWAFSDAVHIIKCIRNNFHDKGQVHYNNKLIDFKFYRRLFETDTSPEFAGMRVCNKLTSAHIQTSTFQRMNVKLAFQLFSRSVADGIKFYREIHSDGFEDSETTEDFTRVLNSLTDILNSSTPTTALYLGCAGLENLKKWSVMLNEQHNTFASTRTLESLRVTIQSTIELSDYLCNSGFKYILTYKFNQDPLERHFGILRSLSCDDHPSTIDFLHLHLLQSIYVPTKLAMSSAMNQEYRSEAPLTSFVSQMRSLAKITEEQNKQLRNEIENKIRDTLVLSEGEIAIPDWENSPSELNLNVAKECLVYHLAGYIVWNASKVTKCEKCLSLLHGNPSDTNPAAKFTFIRDFGTSAQTVHLTHPSEGVFSVLLQVEKVISEKLCAANLWGDIFFECLETMTRIEVELTQVGCCESHVMDIIPKLIFHYMKCRFFFVTRQIRREMKSSKSAKSSRKLSKVSDK